MTESDINNNISAIIKKYHNIAVVGLSNSPSRPSYGVAKYLIRAGYKIFPVNPKYENVLNQKCYPTLDSIPDPVEIVDIFRRPDHILPVVQKSILINAKVIWMQSGIINVEAAQMALNAGLEVVMDRCMKIEHMVNQNLKNSPSYS